MRNVNTVFTHFKNELSQTDPRCLQKDGTLNKNYIITALRYHNNRQYKGSFYHIIEAIKNDKLLNKKYLPKLSDGLTIIRLNDLIKLFNYHNYLQGSLTSYDDQIGLMSQKRRRYIRNDSDIVLGFPYKDSVLKGGMTKDENSVSVSEPFLNEIINAPELTELTDPKILINAKRFDREDLSGKPTTSFNPKQDSLFIKGNNLVALYSLEKKYKRKVKLIYLDPPFNTSNDDFPYNDRFNHSTWLTFMKNRLEEAKKFLRPDGLIFVNIDNNESAYLKVLMDEVFGRENYINTITFKSAPISGTKTQFKDKTILSETNYLHVYAKSSQEIRSTRNINPQYVAKNNWVTRKNKYLLGQNTDNPVLAPLKDILVKNHIITKNTPIKSSLWQVPKFRKFIQNHVNEVCQTTEITTKGLRSHVIRDNKIHKTMYNGKLFYLLNNSRVIFLRDSEHKVDGKLTLADLIGNLWDDKAVSSRTTEHEGSVKFQNAKKPERLLKRIISMTTKSGDLVLDFFAGSATTQAVAMKMHRRFIGIEQMDYPFSNTNDTPIYIKRLQNVINGEQHGISKDNDINWQGGGSFVYAKLKPLNQKYYDMLNMDRNNGSKLDEDAKIIFKKANLVATADLLHARDYYKKNLDGKNSKKKIISKKYTYLMAVLDVNQVYYDEKDLGDNNIQLSPTDYRFNQNFYGNGGEK